MALIIADRVKETATTTGTGTFTLGGAVTGFRTFNAGIGTGNTTYYCIFLDGTNEFEVGLGTYTAPDQLSRDTVLASSNSGSKVNFSQGIKSVFCTQPSSKAAYLDASGNLSITTSNITEGTNLYYTDARFDTRLATKDTADLSEGTNLYYTDARARAAISVSGNAIAYNSSTGVITANFEESPTFTGNVVVSGNLTVTGTTTWLDSTNTQISDKNIVLNYASGDSSANADGAGITIQDAVDASTDASMTWNSTVDRFRFSHPLWLDDNDALYLGNSSDLQIYHDGTQSIITDTGTGQLKILAENTLYLGSATGDEAYIRSLKNGAVTLYYDNSEKLATTSTGIDVTGTVVNTGNVFVGSGASSGSYGYYFRNDSSSGNNASILKNYSGSLDITASLNDSVFEDMVFKTSPSFERMRINANGNVGIGTSSPNSLLEIKGSQPVLTIRDTASPGGTGWTSSDEQIGKIEFWTSDTTGIGPHSVANIKVVNDITAASPSGAFTFSTHLYNSSTERERLRITSAGNVGIGTTSPDSELHLHSTSNTQITFTDDTTGQGTNDGLRVGWNGSLAQMYLFENADMRFATNNSEAMRIDSSGNLLVGTTSPKNTFAEKTLSVISSASNSQGMIEIGGNNTSDSFISGLSFTNEQSTDTSNFQRIAQIFAARDGNNNAGDLVFNVHDGSTLYRGMTIKSSGKVGIGTDSPSVPLHVAGGSSGTNQSLFRTSSGGGGGFQIVCSDLSVANPTWQLNTFFGEQLAFGDGTTEKMRLDSSGNVGIGTTSPSKKLHVSTGDTNVAALFENTSSNGTVAEFLTSGDGRKLTVQPDHIFSNGILYFGSGSYTNVYRAATHIFQEDASNTERMRITGGNVGIGTTSPSAKLEIVGIRENQIRLSSSDLTVQADEDIGGIEFYSNDTGNTGVTGFVTATSEDGIGTTKLRFGTGAAGAASEKLTILSSGNVGIGTSSPSAKLQLHQADSGANYLKFTNTDSGNGLDVGINDAEEAIIFNRHTTDLRFLLNGADRVKFAANGNVGIGTTHPDSKLDVTGGDITVNTTGTGFMHFKYNNGSTGTIGTDGIDLKITANADLQILPTGNVGIGTDSPQSKLHVLSAVADNLRLERDSTNDWRFQLTNGALAIRDATADSERMRIDSSGNVLVGKTSSNITITGVECRADGLLAATRDNAVVSIINRETSDGAAMQFRKDNTTVGSISVTGSATSYNTSSDARLKDDIGDFDGLGIVEQLNPRKFAWKADGQEDIGLYAQEVKELVPNAVSETEDGYYQMDYSKLVTPLIKAVQELTAKVESLEAQLANK